MVDIEETLSTARVTGALREDSPVIPYKPGINGIPATAGALSEGVPMIPFMDVLNGIPSSTRDLSDSIPVIPFKADLGEIRSTARTLGRDESAAPSSLTKARSDGFCPLPLKVASRETQATTGILSLPDIGLLDRPSQPLVQRAVRGHVHGSRSGPKRIQH